VVSLVAGRRGAVQTRAGAELPLPAEELLSWLAVEKGRSANTLAAYRRDLVGYVTWLRSQGLVLQSADQAAISLYVAHMSSTGRAPSSVARALVPVRLLHHFLVQEGSAVTDPSSEVRPPPVPQGLPKALSEEEVTSLLMAVPGNGPVQRRDRAVLEVLYATGMRVSELTGLSLPDLAESSARVARSALCHWVVMRALLWSNGRAQGGAKPWCPSGGLGAATPMLFS
jgi:integrase/recombinase XerD